PSAAPKPHASIAWRHDDFDGAVAAAKAAGKPLLVDAWAPWCHTCLSLQSYVLTDPSLPGPADRFVSLPMDTEHSESAAFVARDGVDAARGAAAGRWLGSVSMARRRSFRAEGGRGVAMAHSGKLDPGAPLAFLLGADRAAMAGRDVEAARTYAEALARAPKDW